MSNFTTGSGPDTLELTVYGDYQSSQSGGVQFTVDVDGTQIGGVLTTTASGNAGQYDTVDVLGDFGPTATHTVAVNHLNPSNSDLVIHEVTINGNFFPPPNTVGYTRLPSIDFSFTTPLAKLVSDAAVEAYQTTVEAGQSTVVATAAPAVPGDTLSIVAAAGTYGTFSLGAVQADGSQLVIYTAPAAGPLTSHTGYPPNFMVTDQQQGLSTTSDAKVIFDRGPNVGATAASVLADTVLKPGQTEVIGNAAPGVPVDTLSLVQTAGAGSVTLNATAGTVVYIAPATITSPTDTVSYTISDQRHDTVVSETSTIPLSVTGSIPISQINTPLVGAPGGSGYPGTPGQSVSEVIAGYSLSLTSITPQVTGGAGGAGSGTSGASGGSATLTIQQDDLGEYVGYGVALAASVTGGAGGASQTAGPGNGGSGGNGGSAVLLADGITALLGGPTTVALQAAGGVGGRGGSSGPGYSGGNPGGLGNATATLSNSNLQVGGGPTSASNVLQVAVTAISGDTTATTGASLIGDVLGGSSVSITVASSSSINVSNDAVRAFSPYGPGAAEGDVSLSLTETAALSAAPGGDLVFQGNQFTGDGGATFSLGLASGGYAIDTAANTISIAGSSPNVLSGFSAFNMQNVSSGNDSFVVGSGRYALALGSGVTTLVVTPTSGEVDVSGATAANLKLEFDGFGSALATQAQFNQHDFIEGPARQTIVAPGGAAINITGPTFAIGNVAFAPNSRDVTVGSGPDTLALQVGADFYLDFPQFTVSVDGTQIGGVKMVIALQSLGQLRLGQLQTIDVDGNFGAGPHVVTMNFLNDAYSTPFSPTMDRNLYLNGATFDGTAIPNATLALLAGGPQTFSFGGPPAPITVGAGADTLALQVSEDAYLGGAQFTVSVDGARVGGTLTASASHAAGQSQVVDVLGNFLAEAHVLTVNFLNDAYSTPFSPTMDRNLYVNGATIDGASVASGHLALLAGGPQSFTFTPPTH